MNGSVLSMILIYEDWEYVGKTFYTPHDVCLGVMRPNICPERYTQLGPRTSRPPTNLHRSDEVNSPQHLLRPLERVLMRGKGRTPSM